MNNRTAAKVLAVMALVAIGVYSISCKPAWSPQGDQVAYICGAEVDDESQFAIAIYDFKNGQSRCIVQPKSGEAAARLVPIEVFWPKRGHKLYYVSAPEDEEDAGTVRFSAYDLRTGQTEVLQEMPADGVFLMSSAYPILLHKQRWLWILGDDACFRVDLKKRKATELKQAQVLIGAGRKVFFLRQAPDDGFVFGRIRTFFSLKEAPLFTLSPEEGEELFPVTAVPEKRLHFACIKHTDKANAMMILDRKGVCTKEILLPRSIEFDHEFLPGAEWNSDGTILWVTVSGEDDERTEYTGIIEINVPEGSVKVIKVNEDERYGDLKPWHLSLSPTGTHLAASMAGDDGFALCLVDLRTEERAVTVVPPPAPLAPAQMAKAQ